MFKFKKDKRNTSFLYMPNILYG